MSRPAEVRVTPLLLVVLMLACWQAFRLWTAVAWYDTLLEFAPRPGPIYTAVSGLAWLVLALLVGWGVWRRRPWIWQVLLWAAAAYSAWYWIDRLVFHQARPNWPFVALLNLVLLAFIGVMAAALRPTRNA